MSQKRQKRHTNISWHDVFFPHIFVTGRFENLTWPRPSLPKPPSLLPNPRQPTALAVDIPLANSPLARLPRNFWEAEDPSGVLFGSFCFRWGAMSTLNLEETNSFKNGMFSALLGKFVEFVARPLSSLNGVMAQWGFCLNCDAEIPMAKTHPDHPTGQVYRMGSTCFFVSKLKSLMVKSTSHYKRWNFLALVWYKICKKRSQTSSTSLHITTFHIALSRLVRHPGNLMKNPTARSTW